MPAPAFDLSDARSICLAPFLLDEAKRDLTHAAVQEHEQSRSRGVAWAGLGATPNRPPRSPEDIRAAAEAALARARSFSASPRGRLLLNLRSLSDQGYQAQAEGARAAFARGFADPDRIACLAELGAALTAIGRIPTKEAHAASLALLDLLALALEQQAA